MIVCVTGCDCSGKSTIVKELSKKLNWETRHFPAPKSYEDGKIQYYAFADEMNNSIEKDIICDRLHEGEWVYAPIYRGYIGDYMVDFEKRLTQKQNYLLVHVKADLETILSRAKIRGEDFVKEEHFSTILKEFEVYKNVQSLPYITIDTTYSKTDEIIFNIISAIKIAENVWKMIRKYNLETKINIDELRY